MPHIPDNHADHDRLLVAAFAAGDAAGAELERATALVAACPDCAALHHDLRAIATALPDLPAPARPRDFRLTAQQAAALRPAGWRRWLAPLAGPRFSFAAPLGTGLAALGIAGLLLAGSLGAPAGADLATGGAAAQPEAAQSVASAGPAEAPAEEPAGRGEAASSSPSGTVDMLGAPAPSAAADIEPDQPAGEDGAAAVSRASDAGAELEAPADGLSTAAIEAMAVLLLASGLGIGGLRLLARRVA